MTDLSELRIFVCTSPIKLNFSFDGWMGLAQATFDQDPCSGQLFLLFNQKRDQIKILFCDVDGFCIWYKRLESHYPHFFPFTEIAEPANNLTLRPASAG